MVINDGTRGRLSDIMIIKDQLTASYRLQWQWIDQFDVSVSARLRIQYTRKNMPTVFVHIYFDFVRHKIKANYFPGFAKITELPFFRSLLSKWSWYCIQIHNCTAKHSKITLTKRFGVTSLEQNSVLKTLAEGGWVYGWGLGCWFNIWSFLISFKTI